MIVALFAATLGGAALVAGALAAIAGFGIGTILTPMLALATGAKVAVAAVAVPHAIGSAQRFWLLREHVERRVLLWFGITSAIGGLIGALLSANGTNRILAVVFGLAVGLAGVSELTRWVERVRLGRRAAFAAGLASGLLGGLVGNQGGIRSAALLGFEVPKESFVATATAIALCVDAARLPVYALAEGPAIVAIWPLLAVATVGVLAGTALGTRILGRIPQATFHRVVGVALLALGIVMVAGGS
ncbi:MAG TPA: TSUP family transporter [Candidatus Limnocylindrales bacterium]|nr:TSUP family transporter [Candidatus Limnocylindrales bacterium]